MAPSPVSGLCRPVPLLAVEAAVDQTNHGACALRVLGAVVPVRLAQAIVAPRAPTAVLDDDVLPREGPVVGFALLRLHPDRAACAAASRRPRAACRCPDSPCRPRCRPRGHARAQAATIEQREVGCRPRHALGHVHDLAGLSREDPRDDGRLVFTQSY